MQATGTWSPKHPQFQPQNMILPCACRLVQGLRPWVAAPCALLLCALADRLRIHRALMLACFATSVALRASLGLLPPGVADVAAVLLLSEAIASPVGVLVDASVVAKCTRDDGAYGRQRCAGPGVSHSRALRSCPAPTLAWNRCMYAWG